MTQLTDEQMARIFKQMGEPSWWILSVLHPVEGKAGINIIRAVEDALVRANAPVKRLDPSTLHRAIARMETLKLVKRLPDELVEIPVGHGAYRRDLRPVWIVTAEGQIVLSRWAQTVQLMARLQPHYAAGGAK